MSFLFANCFSLAYVPNIKKRKKALTLSMYQDVINCSNYKYTSSKEDELTKKRMIFENFLFG